MFIERSYVFDSIPENALCSFVRIEPTDSIPSERTYKDESLIETVLKKIPDTIQYPEYQKFLEAGTKGAANDFLNAVIKQNEDAEKIGKLVSYMAERPGVVKLGKHGLFSQTDDPIDLDTAAEEVFYLILRRL